MLVLKLVVEPQRLVIDVEGHVIVPLSFHFEPVVKVEVEKLDRVAGEMRSVGRKYPLFPIVWKMSGTDSANRD